MMVKVQISFFLIASTLALTGFNQCSCIELTQQNECSTANCVWSNNTCIAKVCNDYKNQTECDIVQECAWTNDDQCLVFTQCSDYTLNSTSEEQCYLKAPICIPGTQVNDTVTCTQGYVNCEDVTDQNICNGLVQNDGQMCWWNKKQCISQDVTYCHSITDSNLCQELDCFYKNNCTEIICNSTDSQQNCSFFQADLIGTVSICNFINNKCDDADESVISALNNNNCYNNTGGTYSWNGTNCVACTGSSSSFGIIFQVFYTLLTLLIIQV